VQSRTADADTFAIPIQTGNSPPFMGYITGTSEDGRIRAFTIRVALIASTLSLASLLSGTLTHERFTSKVFASDLRRLILAERPNASPTAFPFIRDYSVMIHIVMIAGISVLTPMLARVFNGMLAHMISAKTLVLSRQEEFESSLRKLQTRVGRSEIHLLILALAIALTVSGSLGYNAFGIFTYFGPNGAELDAFSATAYQEWWARPFRVSSFAWMFWAAVGNYVDVWVGYFALEVVVFLTANRRSYTFSIDLSNADGRWGWGEVVRAVEIGRRIAILAALGLGGVALIAHPDSYQYLVLFGTTFATAILLFLAPNYFFRKARDHTLASRSLTGPSLSEEYAAIDAIRIALVPDRVVQTRDFIYQSVLTALPGVIAIVNFINPTDVST
jgi:hypothetical protein